MATCKKFNKPLQYVTPGECNYLGGVCEACIDYLPHELEAPTRTSQQIIEDYKKDPAKVIEQLKFCKYQDKIGHPLHMNLAFTALEELIDRLGKCVKDDNGQPLVCYGCSHSAAYMTYSDGTSVEDTDFPGMPSGERPCCFCIRNSQRGLEVTKWYDGSEPLKVPMDCYHSLDIFKQFADWNEVEK